MIGRTRSRILPSGMLMAAALGLGLLGCMGNLDAEAGSEGVGSVIGSDQNTPAPSQASGEAGSPIAPGGTNSLPPQGAPPPSPQDPVDPPSGTPPVSDPGQQPGQPEETAPLGQGWVRYTPDTRIHFQNGGDLTILAWKESATYGDPLAASYEYDEKTETEIFRIFKDDANRAEIRVFNEYKTGSRQFEGYVTFYPPLNDESLVQIWGSDSGATQMMLRGFAANNGSIGINHDGGGTPKFLEDCYEREIKVNVIHLQEDVGNKIIVYLDGKKVLEFADNEKPENHDGNYHKYGCYGTVTDGHENPKVKWRRVRHYRDGTAPR